MILRKLKSTSPICPPEDREDIDVQVKSVDGVPVGNDFAIAVYNNPENYPGYELVGES